MNKSVNILLFILFIPTALLAVVVGFDLPIGFLRLTGESLPYAQEIFYVLAGLFFILGGRRAVQRWSGMKMVADTKRYLWNEPMDQKRVQRVSMYLALEGWFHLVFALMLYLVTPLFWPVAVVFIIFGLDHFIFSRIGKKKKLFRIGITKNAVVFADREVKVAYFTGLRRISIQQQSIYFDYIKDLQISASIDGISSKDRKLFRETIENSVDRNVVFFSEGFKEL
ncbi:MAG: hypothetical protein PHQ74_12280 [Crocinitomicaceae bacterium]|nr:hypothetical protein [Crocinitomicaceae bacterium]